jgi:glycosyltransferase involved in cell wall biosynthesis
MAAVKTNSVQIATVQRYAEDPILSRKPIAEWDAAGLLKVIWETWNDVFGRTLGRAERSLVSELRDVRNKWAHQAPFSSDDADRALDSMARLLTAISAPQADEVNKMKLELRRLVMDEQVRSEKRKVGGSLIEAAASGLALIATPNTGVKDFFTPAAHEGWLLPCGDVDALCAVLSEARKNRDKTFDLGQRAAKRSRSGFSWQDYGEQVRSNFELVMQSRNI